MSSPDFTALNAYAKAFARLDDEKIQTLHELNASIQTYLPDVTEQFYAHLVTIEQAKPFLEGRIEHLKKTHLAWTNSLFTSDFDEKYTAFMYHVGDVHVQVELPIEFMSAGTTLIQEGLIKAVLTLCPDDAARQTQYLAAINAALGFSLVTMQESYQSSSLAGELEKFLKITGMSRRLFDNLARAYSV
ncbi:MAG: protoglobin domain-containing protein [bacterium]